MMQSNALAGRVSFAVTLGLLFTTLGVQSASCQYWQQVFAKDAGDIESLASDVRFVYAGTDSGVFRSSNDGNSWTQVNTGLIEHEIYTLGVSRSGNVFAGTEHHGVYRTTNNGDSWVEKNVGFPDSLTFFAIVCDKNGNIFSGSPTDGVFFSTNEGDSWTLRSTGLPSTFVWSMIITPANELVVGLSGSIVRTNDAGQHWSRLDSLSTNDEVLALACDSNSILYAGTLTGSVLRSSNAGVDWIPVASSPRHKPIRNFAIHDSTVYAATYGDGVLTSSDRGLHWRSMNEGLTDTLLYRLTISPKGYLYCGTYTAKIFRSKKTLGVQSFPIGFQPQLSVYPNPGSRNILITSTDPALRIDRITIYDCVGRSSTLLVSNGAFDATSFRSGMYFVEVESYEHSTNKRKAARLSFMIEH